MLFDSLEDAFYLYKEYARLSGFGACKRSNQARRVYHYSFAFNKYKKHDEKDFEKPPLPERCRAVVGTECKARSVTVVDSGVVNRWLFPK